MRKQMAYFRPECYCANQKAMPLLQEQTGKQAESLTASALTFRWKHETGPQDTASASQGKINITLNNCLHLRGLEKLPRCCRLATFLTLRRSISDFPSRPGMWELFMGN